ncbi:MAG: hypothetical protein ACPG4N_01095 [Gammaproteobacteria bacterium]
MKALLIKPTDQSIEAIDVSGKDQIIALVGYDTVIEDEVGDAGDKLHFDEECFLRGTAGRFQIDSMIPVSGVGVVCGSTDSGELADVQTDIDDLKARTKFL